MAGDGNSVTVFGDLSKPATVLIEKISNAVGILYEPKRIVRNAQAEADARKIGALADLELKSELQQRAMARFLHQETRKQQNIERITAEAISSLPESARPDNLDEDWVAHFFQQCETVSDTEMQTIWAKLLAGEATSPGTFAKRTINCVSNMSKSDAEMFTSVSQFHWMHTIPVPLIYDSALPIYTEKGVNYAGLKHLESLGLLVFEEGIVFDNQEPEIAVTYFGTEVMLTLPGREKIFRIGQVFFTQVGEELSPICGATANPKFFYWVLQRWMDEGHSIYSALPQS